MSWLAFATTTSGTVDGPTSLSSLEVAIRQQSGSSDWMRLSELYVDTTYVAKPTVSITSPPSGAVITDTNQPTVRWTPTIDSDGGVQQQYFVRIYARGARTPLVSYDGTGSAQSWTSPTALTDGDYTAYVSVAQVVNGSFFPSDFASAAFTVNVAKPEPPSLVVTPQPDSARNLLEIATTTVEAGVSDGSSTNTLANYAIVGSGLSVTGGVVALASTTEKRLTHTGTMLVNGSVAVAADFQLVETYPRHGA